MIEHIDPDNFCPTPTGDPFWNESAWFSFSSPERGMHGMVYYFFRPNMNWLVGGPVLWDGTGMHAEECLYYDWHHMQPMPPNARKFDFTSFTSLTVEVVEPLRQYRLRYDDNGFRMNLLWSAVSDPHHFGTMEVAATGASNDNRMHLEQLGRVTGSVQLKGEEYQVDCFSLRDTSWGRRVLDTVKRGSYFWAIADERTAFHAMSVGEEADQDIVGGFLMLDGVVSTIRRGRRFDTVMGDVTPKSFRVVLEDELGRTTEVSAAIRSHLIFNGYPRIQTVWSLLEAQFGNGQNGWGDIQEFQPSEQFRKMVRKT